MSGDLVWPKGSAAHQVGHQRVVSGEPVQFAISVQVRTAVAHMYDAQACAQMERHRHRRPHATQFWMPRRFLDNADVGLAERGLELREHSVRFGAVCTEEPFERIEGELLDREYGEGARSFAALLPAHTVGHEKQVC